MRIFVAGGSGFIGRHLARGLTENGYVVTVGTRASSGYVADSSAVRVVNYDESEMLKGQDVVINLATDYGRSNGSASQVVQANIIFPIWLLEQSIDAGCQLFINTDTYYSEFTGVHHLHTYNRSKRAFTELGQSISRKKIKFCTAKLHHVYGSFDRPEKFCQFIVDSCKRNEQRVPVSHCEQIRDLVYVKDVIDAYGSIIKNSRELSEISNFEVGTGVGVPLKRYINEVKAALSSDASFDFGRVRWNTDEPMRCVSNPVALRELGWEPKYPVDLGVRDMLCNKDA